MPESGLSTSQPFAARRKLLAACAIAGLFGAPGIWLLQVIVSEVLSATACYGVSAPRPAPLWNGFTTSIFAISIVAVLVAAPCAGLAWYGFRLARSGKRAEEPHPHHHEALRSPNQLRTDDALRVRFIALCSALVSTGFLVGVIFVWLAPLFVGPCGVWY
ncbi:hypothetical protein [Paraburkholderia fynbosensis]|uniref:Uncharacterized protein n=1 Tax=Paraburkholderia fynbosensis TaxID=1200993 RepID=A0A6J5GP04_9BURK|nr:hypothetical protein [Paraburkholderia fynbosensis]CAB3803216.1 hypothetical protein LMG27177_05411 [Paraburkholderia fynbosensis]